MGHISIIIPTFRRDDLLRASLSALIHSGHGRDIEVVVVDDSGRSELPADFSDMTNQLDLRYYSQQRKGPGAARNLGAHMASHATLGFLDDDCVVKPGWIATALEMAKGIEREKLILTGPAFLPSGSDLYSITTQFLYDYLQAKSGLNEQNDFFMSNNFVVSKRHFLENGGFSSEFANCSGEDRDFATRFRAAGGKFLFSPRLAITHYQRANGVRFFKQHFSHGRGAYVLSQRTSITFATEKTRYPTFILDHTFSICRWREPIYLRMLATLLFLISQGITIVGYCFERFLDPKIRSRFSLSQAHY